MKVRLCPNDDYSIDPGRDLKEALEDVFCDNPTTAARALALLFAQQVESGTIPREDAVSLLNSSIDLYSDLHWEEAP